RSTEYPMQSASISCVLGTRYYVRVTPSPRHQGDPVMAHKVIVVADPGIDGAFALALALQDPSLEVLGVAATAGNVDAEQATQNVHIIVGQVDPPRWPRLGAALPVEYETDGKRLHGPNGLGGVSFPCAQLH